MSDVLLDSTSCSDRSRRPIPSTSSPLMPLLTQIGAGHRLLIAPQVGASSRMVFEESEHTTHGSPR